MADSELLFLGTGTSVGVPVAACACRTCTSADPHDVRFNSSILLVRNGYHLLVDCGPDFRHSAIKFALSHVDAVWITHAHYDHYAGMDYLRIYNEKQKGAIPVCLTPEDYQYFKDKTLCYLFDQRPIEGGGISQLAPRLLRDTQALDIGPFRVLPVVVGHGRTPVWNLRIENLAYVTDCNAISAEAEARLQGLEVLILSALRYRPHRTHFTIDEAIAVVKRLKPRQAYLMHFTHDVHHQSLMQELQQKSPDCPILPAYDGLRLYF